MSDKYWTMQEAADHLGRTKEGLRHWVRLLPFRVERSEHGHFLFDQKAIRALETIKRLRASGVGLAEIEQRLEEGDAHDDDARTDTAYRDELVAGADDPPLQMSYSQLAEAYADLAASYNAACDRIMQLMARIADLEAEGSRGAWGTQRSRSPKALGMSIR